jgi:molybdopterin/thiamine biosynthesis adenylyltransferase
MDFSRSRILKSITDHGTVSFEEAERRLSDVHLLIAVDDAVVDTAAGQSCVLACVAAATRTYKHVAVLLCRDAVLLRPIRHAASLAASIRHAGATITTDVSHRRTHGVSIGCAPLDDQAFWVGCYWDGWLGGTRAPWDHEAVGASWNPLSGSFAGAIAIRQTFEHVVGGFRSAGRSLTVDLWNAHASTTAARAAGPKVVHLPKNLLLVGLGHLGQGFLWNLVQLPGCGDVLALQDRQVAGLENVGTGVLTSAADLGSRKTRVAERAPAFVGWDVAVLDAPFEPGMRILQEQIPVVISALDSVEPRQWILQAGYQVMLDIGVGHGPVDFEMGQVRVFAKGAQSTWSALAKLKDVDALRDSRAYADEKARDQCGAYSLAQASVAVPFVGLALGAVAVTQLLRLGAMLPVADLLQVELSHPEQATAGQRIEPLKASVGVRQIDLLRRISFD